MKQLKITITLSEYQEKHTIYLGNGEWLKHKSKTFLKSYLRTYKKVLLDNVRILNSYNSQIYALYRTFYFDLSNIEIDQFNQLKLINRAREASPRDLQSKTDPFAELLPNPRGPFCPPEPPQGEHPSTFWRPKEPSKIDPFLGPLKIDPVGGKVAPWPPIGRQWLHFTYFRGPF